jgi:hypothetical protein
MTKRKPLGDITTRVASEENRMPVENPGRPIPRSASDLSLGSDFSTCTEDSGNDGDSDDTSCSDTSCSGVPDSPDLDCAMLEGSDFSGFDVFSLFLSSVSELWE